MQKCLVLFLLLFFCACAGEEQKNSSRGSSSREKAVIKKGTAGKMITLKNVIMHYSDAGRKMTDTLQLPEVTGNFPQLKQALSFGQITDGDPLQEVISNYQDCGCGLTSLKTRVGYEDERVVSLVFLSTYLGAYPSTLETLRTIDVQSGSLHSISREVDADGEQAILLAYKLAMKKQIAAKVKDPVAGQMPTDYKTINQSIDTLTAATLLQQYAVGPGVLILHTENVMPHAAEALEPNRHFEMPLSSLKPYRQPGAFIIP